MSRWAWTIGTRECTIQTWISTKVFCWNASSTTSSCSCTRCTWWCARITLIDIHIFWGGRTVTLLGIQCHLRSVDTALTLGSWSWTSSTRWCTRQAWTSAKIFTWNASSTSRSPSACSTWRDTRTAYTPIKVIRCARTSTMRIGQNHIGWVRTTKTSKPWYLTIYTWRHTTIT